MTEKSRKVKNIFASAREYFNSSCLAEACDPTYCATAAMKNFQKHLPVSKNFKSTHFFYNTFIISLSIIKSLKFYLAQSRNFIIATACLLESTYKEIK